MSAYQRKRLLNIGFGNMIAADRVTAIITSDSAPVKRMISDARSDNRLADATCGRRVRAVLVMDSGQIVLSSIQPETLAGRFNGRGAALSDVEGGE